MTTNAPAAQVERHACPKCEAPAGSSCRTTTGKWQRTTTRAASPWCPHSRRN
ncbi:zinc finger domain-containing protein [Streptomyces fulvorobeus]|uniref:zinc finger domain-containing protein n=1 Tax=Streptomyces fulvorobeus TaxID=284028 RepID=UPI003CD05E4D